MISLKYLGVTNKKRTLFAIHIGALKRVLQYQDISPKV